MLRQPWSRRLGRDSALRSAREELSGGEPLTTNNRMELTAAIVALEALDPPLRRQLAHGFPISARRRHRMDRRLEAQWLAHRRQEAGEKRGSLAPPRRGRGAARHRMALGPRARRRRRQRTRRSAGPRGHGALHGMKCRSVRRAIPRAVGTFAVQCAGASCAAPVAIASSRAISPGSAYSVRPRPNSALRSASVERRKG